SPVSVINSTPSVWLKDEVLTKVMAALDAARGNRLVWLSITNLNAFEIVDAQASQLLFLIYQQTPTVSWLRIVLDGMRGDIPDAVQPFRDRHSTTELTSDDIETYLRRFRAETQLQFDDLSISALGYLFFKKYQSALDKDPANALKSLVAEVTKVADAYITVSAPDYECRHCRR